MKIRRKKKIFKIFHFQKIYRTTVNHYIKKGYSIVLCTIWKNMTSDGTIQENNVWSHVIFWKFWKIAV